MRCIKIFLACMLAVSRQAFSQEAEVTGYATLSYSKVYNELNLADNNDATYSDFSDGAYVTFGFPNNLFITKLELKIFDLLSGPVK